MSRFVSLDRFPTVKTRISTSIDRLGRCWQGRDHLLDVVGDFLATVPISIVQIAMQVFPCFGHKRQDWLVTELAFILRVVALACTHLLSIDRVHGREKQMGARKSYNPKDRKSTRLNSSHDQISYADF